MTVRRNSSARRTGRSAHRCDYANWRGASGRLRQSRGRFSRPEAELLGCLPLDGVAVLNGDDPQLRCAVHAARSASLWGRPRRWTMMSRPRTCTAAPRPARILSVGQGAAASVPVWGRTPRGRRALAAVAVGREFGMSDAEIAAASWPSSISAAHALRGHRQKRGRLPINDATTRIPPPCGPPLELLRDFDSPGRRIVVCGDM